jgi:polysaccharide export outer membrane protein
MPISLAQSTPGLKQNPLAAIQAFEPPANQPYELGPGDEITVEVIGRPELLTKHVIGPDGKITLPVVGSLLIAGQTRDQAAVTIQNALSPFYTEVAVSVGVDHYTSNKIVLLGAVEHPGVQLFDSTPTLLEVISRGGLLLPAPAAAGTGGASIRATVIPDECMIYRGDHTMITVQLRTLLDQGSPLADMRLKRDDIVYVPGQNKFISILGQVMRPGNVRLDSGSTLPELIAEAGGPTEKAGQNPTIEIVHRQAGGQPGRVQKVSYKQFLHPGTMDVTLQPGDVIYVTESGFNKLAYTFQQVSPLVSLFTVAALLN